MGSFAEMLVHRRGADRLDAWAGQAEASTLPELRGFAAGLRTDWDAVRAGLSLAWSSGAVEGHVNRIILWNAPSSQSTECLLRGVVRIPRNC